MTAQIIDGTAIGKSVREAVRQRVAEHVHNGNRPPKLAVLLVGDDPASHVYVKNKEKACSEVGILSQTLRLPESVLQKDLLQMIHQLNADPLVDGILPQLPMPKHLDRVAVVSAISPGKDVDGLSFYNQGRLAWNLPALRPCTPSGVMTLLAKTGIELNGKKAVVVGRSVLVGLPTFLLLMHAGATVTCVHSKTLDPESICREADVLVAAAGVQQLIQKSWVKPGAVVIDVGIHKTNEGKLIGDVDPSVREVASHLTPVPGGVGPMTIAMLMQNCLDAYESHVKI